MQLIAIANIAQNNSALLLGAMTSGSEATKAFMSPMAIRATVTIVTAVPIFIVHSFLVSALLTPLLWESVFHNFTSVNILG